MTFRETGKRISLKGFGSYDSLTTQKMASTSLWALPLLQQMMGLIRWIYVDNPTIISTNFKYMALQKLPAMTTVAGDTRQFIFSDCC